MSRMIENLIGITALGFGAYIFIVYILPQMQFQQVAAAPVTNTTSSNVLDRLLTLRLLKGSIDDEDDIITSITKSGSSSGGSSSTSAIDKAIGDVLSSVGGGSTGKYVPRTKDPLSAILSTKTVPGGTSGVKFGSLDIAELKKKFSKYASASRFARNANIYDLWYGGNFH